MFEPGLHLGPYRLVNRIGAGGMGEVWKAEDTRLGRIVAIKVLPAAFAMDQEAIARLKREARTAAQLYHPNIATIHSIEQEGDHIFIVMEFVDGEPLSNLIRAGTLSEADVCRIGRSVADALTEAHEHGIIHRDIKPDNIVVRTSRIKVLDFGIAKRVGSDSAPNEAMTFVTQQGFIIGTVQYMSPEQALGKPLDARTDIFSLGVVLYEAATGKLPFSGETVTETMTQIIRDEPDDPIKHNPALSPALAAIIVRCLRKNRDDRYATAAAAGAALEEQLGRAKTGPLATVNLPLPPSVTAAVPSVGLAGSPTLISGAQPKTAPEQPATLPSTPLRPGEVEPVLGANLPKLIWVMAIIAVLGAMVFGAMRLTTASPGSAATKVATAPATPGPVAPETSLTVQSKGGTAGAELVESTATQPVGEGREGAGMPVGEDRESADGKGEASATYVDPSPGDEEASSQLQRVGDPTGEEESVEAAGVLYARSMTQLAAGRWHEAQKTLHRVIRKNPHFARAHLRLGEMALARRSMEDAALEFQNALDDGSSMDERERLLARLGVSISTGDRAEARAAARDLQQRNQSDPDLARIVREFPGILGSGPQGGRPEAGRGRFHRRP